MNIRTYNLIIDTDTKHTSLRVKDSFEYANDYFASAVSVYSLMTEIFRLHEMSDEYVYMLAFDNKMKLLGAFEVSHGTGNASLLDARGVFVRALQHFRVMTIYFVPLQLVRKALGVFQIQLPMEFNPELEF